VLVNASRRITVNNTLDERLRLLEDRVRLQSFFLHPTLTPRQMLPEIRRDLFGVNENRKFYV
jgi:V-type H+-transporting ATPase subunit E